MVTSIISHNFNQLSYDLSFAEERFTTWFGNPSAKQVSNATFEAENLRQRAIKFSTGLEDSAEEFRFYQTFQLFLKRIRKHQKFTPSEPDPNFKERIAIISNRIATIQNESEGLYSKKSKENLETVIRGLSVRLAICLNSLTEIQESLREGIYAPRHLRGGWMNLTRMNFLKKEYRIHSSEVDKLVNIVIEVRKSLNPQLIEEALEKLEPRAALVINQPGTLRQFANRFRTSLWQPLQQKFLLPLRYIWPFRA